MNELLPRVPALKVGYRLKIRPFVSPCTDDSSIFQIHAGSKLHFNTCRLYPQRLAIECLPDLLAVSPDPRASLLFIFLLCLPGLSARFDEICDKIQFVIFNRLIYWNEKRMRICKNYISKESFLLFSCSSWGMLPHKCAFLQILRYIL